MAEEIERFNLGAIGCALDPFQAKLNFQVLFRFIFRHKLFIFRQSGHFFRFPKENCKRQKRGARFGARWRAAANFMSGRMASFRSASGSSEGGRSSE
jgi:hypothetical protein